MRRSPPTTLPPTIFETFPRPPRLRTPFLARPLTTITSKSTSHKTPTNNKTTHPPLRPFHSTPPKMASTDALFGEYRVVTPPTVLTSSSTSTTKLTDPQSLLACSVLDLFAGFPSKRKLTLWQDDAAFHDPLTNATGRTQYEAQWYGLKAAFSEIERLGVELKSAGNPIELNLKTRSKYPSSHPLHYTTPPLTQAPTNRVKGIGSEQTIDSQVLIHTTGEGAQMRITKVEDKWDGEIKQGAVKNALRELNSKTVPIAVSVPKSVEEEEQGGK